ARIGKGKSLFRSATGQQNCCNRCRLAHTRRHHVRLHKLHGVVDRESRGDRTARRIDVQLNVFFRIFGLQKQHLRRGQIGHMIVNWRPDKNNVLLQEPGINVVRAFAAAGLFPHHRYERCAAIFYFVGIFHLGICRCRLAGVFHFASVAAFAAATVLILAFCASQSSVLSLRSFALILSSVPCFVKRARIASADSPLWLPMCSSSCVTSVSVTSTFSAVAMRSMISSAFTSS